MTTSLSTGGDYHSAMASSGEPDYYVPWWKTRRGKLGLLGCGVGLVVLLLVKKLGSPSVDYSYAEECVDNLMTGVSMDCGAAIFGYDCDGTLDCQVAHKNIYCAKCGCNNELVGKLFEDLPQECESYF